MRYKELFGNARFILSIFFNLIQRKEKFIFKENRFSKEFRRVASHGRPSTKGGHVSVNGSTNYEVR